MIMAENNSKKKRFIYKSVLGNASTKQKKHEPAPPLVDFPDDFDTFTQPTKKMKLDLEKSPTTAQKKKIEKTDNYFDDINFDDDDAFDLKEIDEIEIAASQQLGLKPKTNPVKSTIKDPLDQLLEDTQHIRPSIANGRSTAFMPPKDRPGPSTSNKYQNNDRTVHLPLSQRNDSYKNKLPVNQNSTTMNAPSNRTNGHSTSIYNHRNRNETYTEQQQINIQNEAEKKRNLEESFQKQYHQAQKTVTEYKTKLDTMQKKFNSKDGEIKILREKLRKSSENEMKIKERLVTLESSSKTEQSKKESDLLKEVEKLKTQLKFKENEVKEAISKQKQLERQPRVKPPLKSPIKDNKIPDGFQQTKETKEKDKSLKLPMIQIKKPEKLDRNPMTRLNNYLKKGTISSNSATQIMKKVSLLSLDKPFSVEQPEFKCQHPKNAPFPKEKTSIFMNDIQSSLEMLEQNDAFVVEYVRRLLQYLNSLEQLFSNQTSKDRASQQASSSNKDTGKKRKDSSGTPCNICNQLYQIGILCLFTLKESCLTYRSVCTYLLSCFETRRSKSKKNVKLDGVSEQMKQEISVDEEKYFKKLPDTNILIKKMNEINIKIHTTTPNTSTGQSLWENLLYLRKSKLWTCTLEELCFEFQVNLLFWSTKLPEASCFVKWLQNKDHLLNYLSKHKPKRVLQVIQLLTNCVGIKEITKLLCANSERCPLLTVYNTFLLAPEGTGPQDLFDIFRSVVRLFSSLIAQPELNAYQVLLSSKCQCSNDIIECFITYLYDEFKDISKSIFNPLSTEVKTNKHYRERLSAFRDGMSLFCKLCVNDKMLSEKRAAVEWSYFNLLAGTRRMYRKIPEVSESEVHPIEDLLEQYYDFDEDMEDVAMQQSQQQQQQTTHEQ
eukprot:TCONS_00047888-protein